MIEGERQRLDEFVVPPLGVAWDVVSFREFTSVGVVEVVICGEVPNVLITVFWLEYTQKHIDSHLLVSI